MVADDAKIGETIGGRYRLDAVIGRGGMGVVYSALHLATGREVAIKLLRASAQDSEVRRFLREARIAARVVHPNLSNVIDVGQADDGGMYLVLERLEGETLRDHLRRRGAMRPPDAIDTLVPILDALEALHAVGVVHRDVKPSNIFLSADAAGRVVPTLLDLGICKNLDPREAMTGAGTVLGTPNYMAPEQVLGASDVGPGADVWAMGVVLFEALVGERPFQAPTTTELFHRIASERPPPIARRVPSLPPGVADAIDLALAYDPSTRHARASGFADALVEAGIDAGWVLTCRMPVGPAISIRTHRQVGRPIESPLTVPLADHTKEDTLPHAADAATPSEMSPLRKVAYGIAFVVLIATALVGLGALGLGIALLLGV